MPTLVSLQPPEFTVGAIQRRFYWELLLEPEVHPLGHPVSWTSQQTWEWGPFGLRHVPVIAGCTPGVVDGELRFSPAGGRGSG